MKCEHPNKKPTTKNVCLTCNQVGFFDLGCSRCNSTDLLPFQRGDVCIDCGGELFFYKDTDEYRAFRQIEEMIKKEHPIRSEFSKYFKYVESMMVKQERWSDQFVFDLHRKLYSALDPYIQPDQINPDGEDSNHNCKSCDIRSKDGLKQFNMACDVCAQAARDNADNRPPGADWLYKIDGRVITDVSGQSLNFDDEGNPPEPGHYVRTIERSFDIPADC